MSKRTVAEVLVDELAEAGVTRLYGLVGDSLNPVSDCEESPKMRICCSQLENVNL